MKVIVKCILILSLPLSLAANANIKNGSFEHWNTTQLADWPTIDSGIMVSKETNIVKLGSSSAKINVKTTSQSATDFQQSFAVIAGQTYQFSVWVYHTQGHVKARFNIDGYQDYSNPALKNQWQKISYNYQASSTKNITIGLRFYDLSGFTGNEVVYIDDFQPSNTSTPPPPDGGNCQDRTVSLTLITDRYGYETSWQLNNSVGEKLAHGQNLSSDTTYHQDFCLTAGDYQFTIKDSYSDGMCCTYGNGSYRVLSGSDELFSGGQFGASETKTFTLGSEPGNPPPDPTGYYATITNQTGFGLKTALHHLIKNHQVKGYSALWVFYAQHSLDKYFENDGSILDIYSENTNGNDRYNYHKVSDQCGTYNSEADCYNREHSFPRSWFGGNRDPMNSDVHHIFATDGYVNSKRGSYPFGEVGTPQFVSKNNSKLGTARSSLGYSGTVFEPIDEFKGDLARAHLYIATRYQNVIARWQHSNSSSNAVLDGSSAKVFETWQLNMLLRWHINDPVSQLERDRNQAGFAHQGNRNPFVDHPEYAARIWGN